MKERYSIRPKATWLELLNDKLGAECTVHFCENITAVDEDDGEGNTVTNFEADHYAVKTNYREGLMDAVEANREEWLAKAMEAEGGEDTKTLKTRVKELEELTKEQDDIITDLLLGILE